MHDYFRKLWENREKALTVGLIVAFLLLAVCWFSYSLGLRNAGKDLPDNGDTAERVRNEVAAAGSGISTAKSGIDRAADTAGRIEERIADAAERARYVQGTADEGRKIIKECESILAEVRSRGTKNPAPH